MRVLRSTEHTVLWLLDSTTWARRNLLREAEARGVAPERLVFAPRIPNTEHLARHRHADLFLDTFAYNAHTTGSDALWMGVPMVSLAGHQFAARVGASLLYASGLPELVAETEADYEAKVLGLVRDPAKLAAVKEYLEENRGTLPLFDTVGHTRALEAAYDGAHDRWRERVSPGAFSVS